MLCGFLGDSRFAGIALKTQYPPPTHYRHTCVLMGVDYNSHASVNKSWCCTARNPPTPSPCLRPEGGGRRVFWGAGRWRKIGVHKKNAPPGTPKLLTVRNPFDRILSAYRDKIQALEPANPFRNNIFNDIVRHHRFISFEDRIRRDKLLNEAKEMSKTIPYERGISVYVEGSTNPYLKPVSATFPEFIKNLLTDHWRNEHWAEMTERCAPCKMDYEFILKTEDYMCEYINDARKDSQYADVFEYYGQLPDDTIDAFVQWFKDDCFLFDYDCESQIFPARVNACVYYNASILRL
eukprot:sb/3467547/